MSFFVNKELSGSSPLGPDKGQDVGHRGEVRVWAIRTRQGEARVPAPVASACEHWGSISCAACLHWVVIGLLHRGRKRVRNSRPRLFSAKSVISLIDVSVDERSQFPQKTQSILNSSLVLASIVEIGRESVSLSLESA